MKDILLTIFILLLMAAIAWGVADLTNYACSFIFTEKSSPWHVFTFLGILLVFTTLCTFVIMKLTEYLKRLEDKENDR